jgi:hypothetical protein
MENLPQVVSDPEMIIMSDEENFSDEDQICPTPLPRENLNTDEVFSKSKKKKKEVVEEGVPVIEKVVTQTKKGKARKPLSDEHKEKLKIARQKALEKRKENAAERKALKELEQQAIEKTKAKKKKELQDIVNEVPPEPVKPIQTEVKAEIDPNIIQRAIDEALTKNEIMRQKRKAEKKLKLDEEVKAAKAREQIKQMVYPPSKIYYGEPGFYSKNIFNLH